MELEASGEPIWPNARKAGAGRRQGARFERRRAVAVRDLADQEVRNHRSPPQCRCGVCPSCLENQKWERIFRDKFADPDYYNRDLELRFSSPLHSF